MIILIKWMIEKILKMKKGIPLQLTIIHSSLFFLLNFHSDISENGASQISNSLQHNSTTLDLSSIHINKHHLVSFLFLVLIGR